MSVVTNSWCSESDQIAAVQRTAQMQGLADQTAQYILLIPLLSPSGKMYVVRTYDAQTVPSFPGSLDPAVFEFPVPARSAYALIQPPTDSTAFSWSALTRIKVKVDRQSGTQTSGTQNAYQSYVGMSSELTGTTLRTIERMMQASTQNGTISVAQDQALFVDAPTSDAPFHSYRNVRVNFTMGGLGVSHGVVQSAGPGNPYAANGGFPYVSATSGAQDDFSAVLVPPNTCPRVDIVTTIGAQQSTILYVHFFYQDNGSTTPTFVAAVLPYFVAPADVQLSLASAGTADAASQGWYTYQPSTPSPGLPWQPVPFSVITAAPITYVATFVINPTSPVLTESTAVTLSIDIDVSEQTAVAWVGLQMADWCIFHIEQEYVVPKPVRSLPLGWMVLGGVRKVDDPKIDFRIGPSEGM